MQRRQAMPKSCAAQTQTNDSIGGRRRTNRPTSLSDPSGQRLFVCALGNNSLEVIDPRKGERVHSITGLGSPQGVAYIPDGDRIFVANDRGGICRIYDGKSFQTAKSTLKMMPITLATTVGPPGKSTSDSEAAVSLSVTHQTKHIKLLFKLVLFRSFQLEKKGSRIFVNVPNSRHVAVVDRDKAEVVAGGRQIWPLRIFPWHLMKRIIDYSLAAAILPG